MRMKPLSIRIPFRIRGCDCTTLEFAPHQYWHDAPDKPVLASWRANGGGTSSFGMRSDLFFRRGGGQIAIAAMQAAGMDRGEARHVFAGMRELIIRQLGAGVYPWLRMPA
jgi:hypothetical protein